MTAPDPSPTLLAMSAIRDDLMMPDAARLACRNGAAEIERLTAALAAQRNLHNQLAGPIGEVASERRRQVDVEGCTPEHDDAHDSGEMARAAAAYACYSSVDDSGSPFWEDHIRGMAKALWPWRAWWKPKDRRRDLIRAGALIVAEIERLDRHAKRAEGK